MFAFLYRATVDFLLMSCMGLGLIAEIMSKGKHITYEELCNTVLPVRILII